MQRKQARREPSARKQSKVGIAVFKTLHVAVKTSNFRRNQTAAAKETLKPETCHTSQIVKIRLGFIDLLTALNSPVALHRQYPA